jgi:hypothetical protein
MVASGGSSGPTPVAYSRPASLLPLFLHFEPQQLEHCYVRFMEEEQRSQEEAAHLRGQRGKETPQMVEIHDFQGFGLRHLRCVAGAREAARILGIGQKYYPENLDTSFILNAPSLFDMVWWVLSQALDERTRQKVIITSDSTHPRLQEFLSNEELQQLQRRVPSLALDWKP